MSDLHVYVAMPAYGLIHPQVAINFTMMFSRTVQSGVDCSAAMTNMCGIHWARNRHVAEALDHGATHIFWVDSDVIVPSGALLHLLAHGETAASGLYCHKQADKFRHVPLVFDIPFHYNEDFPLDKPSYVDGVGHGCFLIEADVYRKMDLPWYEMTQERGEDVYFCRRMKEEQGVRVLLDPEVQCGHIGPFTTYPDHWQILKGTSDADPNAL